MNHKTHLYDRVSPIGSNYATMICGATKHLTKDTYFATNHTGEVTCTKCKGFINNPYRSLRKYAKVKVLESFYVTAFGDYGNRLDMVASNELPGTWQVWFAFENKPHNGMRVAANNMADLGYKLLSIYETELKEIKNQTK